MVGHKKSPNKFKKTDIISSIFSNSKGKKLEINYKNKTGKFMNMWRWNNMLLKKDQWAKEEIKTEIKK